MGFQRAGKEVIRDLSGGTGGFRHLQLDPYMVGVADALGRILLASWCQLLVALTVNGKMCISIHIFQSVSLLMSLKH